MKTTVKKSTAFAFLVFAVMISNAQIPVLVKTLNVTIYSSEKYEASKQILFTLTDSCKCEGVLINETITENGNQKITLEVSVNDLCFKIIDKRLPELGYISFKNLTTADKSDETDTVLIKKELAFLQKQKSHYSMQLTLIKADCEHYNKILQEQLETEKKIFETEKLITSAATKINSPHKMQITICK